MTLLLQCIGFLILLYTLLKAVIHSNLKNQHKATAALYPSFSHFDKRQQKDGSASWHYLAILAVDAYFKL